MSDEAFKGEINKYDILFLCEVWDIATQEKHK